MPGVDREWEEGIVRDGIIDWLQSAPPSVPPSPSTDQPRKRRPRKDDGDFVMVNK